MNFLFCGVCRLAVRWIFFKKNRFFHNYNRWVQWAHCLGKWWAIFWNHGTMTRATINLICQTLQGEWFVHYAIGAPIFFVDRIGNLDIEVLRSRKVRLYPYQSIYQCQYGLRQQQHCSVISHTLIKHSHYHEIPGDTSFSTILNPPPPPITYILVTVFVNYLHAGYVCMLFYLLIFYLTIKSLIWYHQSVQQYGSSSGLPDPDTKLVASNIGRW